MLKRIIISKQCDHDLDLAPFWLHWYRNVFKADKLILTPIKTRASNILEISRFYAAQGIEVLPIHIQEWNEDQIWRSQLQIARSRLPAGGNFVLISADTDQFFAPLAEERLSGSEVIFHRVNMVSAQTPTPSSLSTLDLSANRSFDLTAGFINTL